MCLPETEVRRAIAGRPSTTISGSEDDDDLFVVSGWTIDRPGAACACGSTRLIVLKRRLVGGGHG
jgi:hypothetical protein